ncbi:MAG: DoxX family protein [Bacteroidota bacterium]|nr:DoxX family protein [Bacteroidota bacterium]
MKIKSIIYWVITSLISIMMLFSAYSYLTNPMMKEGFVHLGFPGYFRVELAIAKILGAIALLVPFIPAKIKEFAYVGFSITFISAFIAHTSSGDPMSVAIFPIIALVLLMVSHIYYLKIFNDKR